MSEATMTSPAKSEISEGLQRTTHLLNKDIGAMTDEMLANCPGGKARCGFDLLFEIASVNRLFASIMRGEASDAPRPDGWIVAPADYRSKEAAQKDVADSIADVLASLEAMPDDQLNKEIETPLGAMTTARLVGMIGNHMMYHSGQLNYIQTLHGDDAFHWMEA